MAGRILQSTTGAMAMAMVLTSSAQGATQLNVEVVDAQGDISLHTRMVQADVNEGTCVATFERGQLDLVALNALRDSCDSLILISDDARLVLDGDAALAFPTDARSSGTAEPYLAFPGDALLPFPTDAFLPFPSDARMGGSEDGYLAFPGDARMASNETGYLAFPGDAKLSSSDDRYLAFPGDAKLSSSDDRYLAFPGDAKLSNSDDRYLAFPGDAKMIDHSDAGLAFPTDARWVVLSSGLRPVAVLDLGLGDSVPLDGLSALAAEAAVELILNGLVPTDVDLYQLEAAVSELDGQCSARRQVRRAVELAVDRWADGECTEDLSLVGQICGALQ